MNPRHRVNSNSITLAAAALMIATLPACSSVSVMSPADLQNIPNCADGGRLEVTQVCKLKVDADKARVPLQIATYKGDRYKIEVPPGQSWKDWTRPESSPSEGESGNWLMNLFTQFRRMPEEPWMVLGMSTSTHMGQTAKGATCSEMHVRVEPVSFFLEIPEPMKISFFANDVPLLNWNNSGSVWVTVTRIYQENENQSP
jgi:hypothetical protein